MIEIEKYNPCEDALEFRKQYATFKEAWEACPRGDWLLWLAQYLDVDLKTLTLAKVRCVSTVRHLMKDQRSLNALDVAERFMKGEATLEELDNAGSVAGGVAYTARNAGNAAGYSAAVAADDAAYTAATGAGHSAYTAARKANQKSTADICREILTEIVFEKLGI